MTNLYAFTIRNASRRVILEQARATRDDVFVAAADAGMSVADTEWALHCVWSSGTGTAVAEHPRRVLEVSASRADDDQADACTCAASPVPHPVLAFAECPNPDGWGVDLETGARVEVGAWTDWFMLGARYGAIVATPDSDRVRVKLDRVARPQMIHVDWVRRVR